MAVSSQVIAVILRGGRELQPALRRRA